MAPLEMICFIQKSHGESTILSFQIIRIDYNYPLILLVAGDVPA